MNIKSAKDALVDRPRQDLDAAVLLDRSLLNCSFPRATMVLFNHPVQRPGCLDRRANLVCVVAPPLPPLPNEPLMPSFSRSIPNADQVICQLLHYRRRVAGLNTVRVVCHQDCLCRLGEYDTFPSLYTRRWSQLLCAFHESRRRRTCANLLPINTPVFRVDSHVFLAPDVEAIRLDLLDLSFVGIGFDDGLDFIGLDLCVEERGKSA